MTKPAHIHPDDAAPRLRIAGIQMHATPELERNLEHIANLLVRCAESADLVILPECCLCLGNARTTRAAARTADDWTALLSRLLQDSTPLPGPAVVFGSVPVRESDDTRIVNRCLVFDGRRRLSAFYDKMHLFRLRTPDGHGPDETRIYTPGRKPVAVRIRGWTIALSICYDLRFPEYYRALAPFDLLLCPAAFTRVTGRAHWLPLLRARAVENLAFAIGVNQWGCNQETGVTLYGNSAIVSPWGRVLRRAGADGDQILICELRKSAIIDARKRLPALEHRTIIVDSDRLCGDG